MRFHTAKTLLWMLLCACTSATVAAEELNSLILTTKDGGKLVVALKERPQVTFAAGEVVLATAEATWSYGLAEGLVMTFGDEEKEDGVADVKQAAVVACRNHSVEVSRAVPGSLVALYGTDGRLLRRAVVSAQGTAVLPLGAEAVQVVRVGGVALKVRCNK